MIAASDGRLCFLRVTGEVSINGLKYFGCCLAAAGFSGRKILMSSVPALWYSFFVIFRLDPSSGQPLYLQLIQQVRHAVEIGTLQDGDQMPGIRALAEQLVISHNTVAKAYTELQHAGLLDLRHGSGAYITASKRGKTRTAELLEGARRVRHVIESLRDSGLSTDEIRRLFETQLLDQEHTSRKA
jgi:GntR family transcriptional regulator